MKKKEIKSPPGDYYYHIWNKWCGKLDHKSFYPCSEMVVAQETVPRIFNLPIGKLNIRGTVSCATTISEHG
jgi:hypothetical protein